MRRLSLGEVLRVHRLVIESSGGGAGRRDLGCLESALAQPWVTFDGVDLYEDVVAKAATLGFALIQGIRSSTETSESDTRQPRSFSC